jgi:hypothetical protein
MAKKPKIAPIDPWNVEVEYRAYFNPETDSIFLVTNMPHDEHTHYAVITKDEHADLCNGKLKFSDCIIDRQIKLNGDVEYKMLTKQTASEFNFKNKSLEWIKSAPTDSTQFVIEWSKESKSWTFCVAEPGRKILEGAMYDSTLVFFVMLETDFDFLVRTFYIKLHDVLKAGKIVYEFESAFEENIAKLSIASNHFFESYGLKIND